MKQVNLVLSKPLIPNYLLVSSEPHIFPSEIPKDRLTPRIKRRYILGDHKEFDLEYDEKVLTTIPVREPMNSVSHEIYFDGVIPLKQSDAIVAYLTSPLRGIYGTNEVGRIEVLSFPTGTLEGIKTAFNLRGHYLDFDEEIDRIVRCREIGMTNRTRFNWAAYSTFAGSKTT